MINVNTLSIKLKDYLHSQVTTLAKESPIIGVLKPVITRVVDNNIYKVKDTLNLISDKEGNVDIENILEEMVDSIMNTNPFKLNTQFGDIEIGGGYIKLNIPLTNKRLILNQDDIQNFKSLLIAN